MRAGFVRALVFAACAGALLPGVALLLTPRLGVEGALGVHLLATGAAWLAWLAPDARRGVAAAALFSALGVAVLLLAPDLATQAVALAVAFGAARGVAHPTPSGRALLRELALATAGLALARLLAAPDPVSAALAVWGYFLAQSAFFLDASARHRGTAAGPDADDDRFDRARRAAEALLDR